MYRLAKARVIHERDTRDPRAMLDQVRERDVAHRERDQPVRDALGALEPRRPARRERTLQLGRTLGLDTPHRGAAPPRGAPHADAGDEPAPASGPDPRPHVV